MRKKSVAAEQNVAAQEEAAASAPPRSPTGQFQKLGGLVGKRRRQRDTDDDYDEDASAKRRRSHHAPTTVTNTTDATQSSGDGFDKPFVMSHSILMNMQLKYNLTSRQMNGILKTYNNAAPPGVTMHQPHFRDAAVQFNQLLLHQFTTMRMSLNNADPAKIKYFRAVFPTDISNLLQQLSELHARDIDSCTSPVTQDVVS